MLLLGTYSVDFFKHKKLNSFVFQNAMNRNLKSKCPNKFRKIKKQIGCNLFKTQIGFKKISKNACHLKIIIF